MITVFIWLFTAVMVVDCLALVFLILIQLPKKDAGAGLAFGGSATDALFGAGSGNVLTKITKYAAGIFFALSILLSMAQSYVHRQEGTRFLKTISQPGRGPGAAADTTVPAAPGAVPPAATTPGSTNSTLLTTPGATTNKLLSTTPGPTTNKPITTPVEATNLPAAPATGAPK